MFPIAEAVAEEFQICKRGKVRVTVGIAGTGGGFKRFCRGETDISNASRPILKEEMEACRAAGIKYMELPVAFDALTVVVNPQNTWVKTLTVADLKKMWEPGAQGRITKWNQVRSDWPAQPLMLFGPGADSGTFDYFTEAVNGKAKASRGDFTASEDDNVLVQGVENNKNALGYFGYAYYIAHKDKHARGADRQRQGQGSRRRASKRSSTAATSRCRVRCSSTCATRPRSAPKCSEFIQFYLTEGAELAKEVGYVPLPRAGLPAGAEALQRQEDGHRVRRRAGSRRDDRQPAGARRQALIGPRSSSSRDAGSRGAGRRSPPVVYDRVPHGRRRR